MQNFIFGRLGVALVIGLLTTGCITTTQYTVRDTTTVNADAGIERIKVLLAEAKESKNSQQAPGQLSNISADYEGLSWDSTLVSSTATMAMGGGLLAAVADSAITANRKDKPYLGKDSVSVRYSDMNVVGARVKKNTGWGAPWKSRITIPTKAHLRDGQSMTTPINLYFSSLERAKEFLDLVAYLQKEGIRAQAASAASEPPSPVSSPTPDTSSAKKTGAEALTELKKLRDDGLITEEEYQAKRKELLDQALK